jgi:outer membrane protein TolC
MFRKNIILIFILGFLFLSAQPAYLQGAEATDLDSLIEEALQNNPRVKAAYNKWHAARYKAKHVSALPDPMGRYVYFGESVETRVGPQENKYGFSQTAPFPLKLYLKGKAELKHSDMLKEEYESTKRELVKEIKFVYYDIFWLDKAINILDGEKAILENLEKVARVQFETNRAPQQDAIKAGVEISKIIDKTYLIQQQRRSKTAMINSLLNRPIKTPLGKTENIKFRIFKHSLDELHGLASKHRQELVAANLDVERAGYEKSLSQLNFIPDFTFGFDYIDIGSGSTISANDGKDAWSATFAINIPLWLDKQYAEIMEKQSALKAARHSAEDVANRVTYEIEDIYFKITTYGDIVTLYKTTLIPQTEQSFEAARIGYETGKVDFLNWLESERVLLQTRLAYYKAIVDYEKSIAYLERVVGTDL